MTYDWLSTGYRVIPEWSGYVMSAGLEVWSLARQVRSKGGATRQTSARQLTPSQDGRVSLCQDGKTERFHVARQLYPRVFPDLLEKDRQQERQRPQVRCHNGHPLMEPINPEIFGSLADIVQPNVAYWGAGNRTCLYCSDAPKTFPTHTYSLEFGMSGISAAGHATFHATNSQRLAELERMEHGYTVRNS